MGFVDGGVFYAVDYVAVFGVHVRLLSAVSVLQHRGGFFVSSGVSPPFTVAIVSPTYSVCQQEILQGRV